PS
ncbi:hypothetical protein ECEC1850_3592, partial [Escherichia coli EC1850]